MGALWQRLTIVIGTDAQVYTHIVHRTRASFLFHTICMVIAPNTTQILTRDMVLILSEHFIVGVA